MAANTVITIGRQTGSGGRDVGKLLAKELGIKCYDKELLDRAAKDSGICHELFEHHDEKPTNRFFIFFSYGHLFFWLFFSSLCRYAY